MTDDLEPSPDCGLCPRLADFRAANRTAHPDFFNRPVPAFGPLDAEMLIVGLAPGLKGANRTGRPFTGDYAGDLLYPTLIKFGFARGRFGADPDDGLTLENCRITNAVRCVPPANKPVGAEVRACGEFLAAEITAMPNLDDGSGAGRAGPRGNSRLPRAQEERLQVRSCRRTSPARLQAGEQLPLLPLQHQYGAADHRNVRGCLPADYPSRGLNQP